MTNARIGLAVAALIALTAASACDDDNGESGDSHEHGGGRSTVAEDARRIEVTADSFSFAPDRIEIEAGEDVAIVLDNIDNLPHDFKVDEFDAHVDADPSDTATGALKADEPGTYTYYCSIAGHRASGMEGTLVVT